MLGRRGEPTDIRAQTLASFASQPPLFHTHIRSQIYAGSVRQPCCSPTGEAGCTLFPLANCLSTQCVPLSISAPPTHRTAWLALCPPCLYVAPTTSSYTIISEREDKASYHDSPYVAHWTPCVATCRIWVKKKTSASTFVIITREPETFNCQRCFTGDILVESSSGTDT